MKQESAPSIIMDQVSLSYEGQLLFENLSLEIPGGQCTCILGPSGCGKSTLLRLITGEEQAEKNPTAFINLMGKVLPLQVKADIEGEVDHVVRVEWQPPH